MKADRLRTLRLVLLADSLNVWSSARVHHVLFVLVSQDSCARAIVDDEVLVASADVIAGGDK